MISLPVFMSHASIPSECRSFDQRLIRVSIGIEDVSDLMNDLDQAFY